MKANALMTGNWMKIKNLKYPVKRLVCIDEYLGKVDFLDGEELITTSINNVLPIPLTREILEKNGFKKDERNENYYKWNWYILEDNVSYDMETGIVRIFKTSDLTFCHPIGYVHELQNALRLCEVEKEITI